MTQGKNPEHPETARESASATTISNTHLPKWPGWVILAGLLLAMAVMSHHPAVHGSGPAAFVEEVNQFAQLNRIVHGAGLLAIALIVLGFWSVYERLGQGRILPRAGWVAFVAGAAAVTHGALYSGFIAPGIAERYAQATAAELSQLRPALVLASEAMQAVDQLSVMAWSLALLLWSVELLRRRPAHWLLGSLGLLAGAIPALAMLGGQLSISVTGYSIFLAIQALWQVLVAIQLIRGKL